MISVEGIEIFRKINFKYLHSKSEIQIDEELDN